MLRTLLNSFAMRPMAAPGKPGTLQPFELQEILRSLPELNAPLQPQLSRGPRSVCSSLKDLCEL